MHRFSIACTFAALSLAPVAQASNAEDALHILFCVGTFGVPTSCKVTLETGGTGAAFQDSSSRLQCGKLTLNSVEVAGSPRMYVSEVLCNNLDANGNVGGATGVKIVATWDGKKAIERIGDIAREAVCDGDPWIEDGKCGIASASGMTIKALSTPFPGTAGIIPEARKKILRIEANTPRISAPQNNQKLVANQPLIIKVQPNPAAPSQHIRLQLVDMAGNTQTASFIPAMVPNGYTWPHKLSSGFAGLQARWDYDGAPKSVPLTLAISDAPAFPAYGANTYKQADSYLTSNGCVHFQGHLHEYVCTPEPSYVTCTKYLANPALEVKKCYKGA